MMKSHKPSLPIYLDYNATTPVDPAVAEAMQPYLQGHFGNPSSAHVYGRAAHEAVVRARDQLAQLLRCTPGEIVFTASGSEANNLALKGMAARLKNKGRHIITSAIEHPAILNVCRYLENNGYRITRLPVDSCGMVKPDALEQALSGDTILVSVMHANNEVGTIQPIREMAELAHAHGALMHSDCAQSVGKIPVSLPELGVDMLSLAGHKFYGPKGVGALVVRAGLEPEPLIHGAGHENKRRAGTENVLEIVGLGAAAAQLANLPDQIQHSRQLRDQLESGLRKMFPDIRINGHPEKRLPNTSSVSFPGLKADDILQNLSGVAASAGAACHKAGISVSAVLQAMNLPDEYAMGTLRLSVGRFTTETDIENALAEFREVIPGL